MEYYIGEIGTLPENRATLVEINDVVIGVYRRADQIFAYLNECPHLIPQ